MTLFLCRFSGRVDRRFGPEVETPADALYALWRHHRDHIAEGRVDIGRASNGMLTASFPMLVEVRIEAPERAAAGREFRYSPQLPPLVDPRCVTVEAVAEPLALDDAA